MHLTVFNGQMLANKEHLVLKCQNVSLGYDGHIVVKYLDFTIEQGDFICIVGENGGGKTTLVKSLLRLISPIEGKISFSDDLKPTEIGYLSQEVIAKKDFPAGVFEIVLSGNIGKMKLRPFYTRTEKNIAYENLKKLGITDLRNLCFRELSGGQQRRVLLARSLCAAEKLLVLDEPFAGLDPLISAELYNILKNINKENGMTIIIVTHDIEAASCANKVLHIQRRQLFFGSMNEYRNSPIGKNFFIKKEAADD